MDAASSAAADAQLAAAVGNTMFDSDSGSENGMVSAAEEEHQHDERRLGRQLQEQRHKGDGRDAPEEEVRGERAPEGPQAPTLRLREGLRISTKSEPVRARMARLKLENEADDDDSDLDFESDSAHTPKMRPKMARTKSLPVAPCLIEPEEMIDFDIVKRRSRSKLSSKLDKPSVKKGRMWFLKVLLLPFFPRFWAAKLNRAWLLVSLAAYLSQVGAVLLYFAEEDPSEITRFEVRWCSLLLVVVAGLIGHCAAVSSAVSKALREERNQEEASEPRRPSLLEGDPAQGRSAMFSLSRICPEGDSLDENDSGGIGASDGKTREPTSRRSLLEQLKEQQRLDAVERSSSVPPTMGATSTNGADDLRAVPPPYPSSPLRRQLRPCRVDSGEDSPTLALPPPPRRRSVSQDSVGEHLRQHARDHGTHMSSKSLKYESGDSDSSDEDEDETESDADSLAGSKKSGSSSKASSPVRPRLRSSPFSTRGSSPVPSPLRLGTPAMPSSPRSSSVRSMLWSKQGLMEDRELSVSEVRDAIYEKIAASKPARWYEYVGYAAAFTIGAMPNLVRLWRSLLPVLCWAISRPVFQHYVGRLEAELYDHFCPQPAAGPSPDICPWDGMDAGSVALAAAESLSRNRGAAFIAVSSMFTSCFLVAIFFHHVKVAEEAFRRRLLYAKYFSKLTSSRRARKANLPHFRLNKVNHIRVWLELRSDSREAHNSSQRFGDAAANALVLTTVTAVSIVCLRMFSGTWSAERVGDLVMLVAVLFLGTFLYRFMHLASRAQKKYDTTKILYTEQLNLYIKIFANPDNKEELVACNNMIKIAVKLTDEKKGSGGGKGKDKVLLLNPIIYNLLRVTILSALGTMSSDFLGFKIRLWKL